MLTLQGDIGMPMEYNYDADANIIHAHPYADISLPEVLAYFNDLIHNSAIADRSIEVVHLEKVDNFLFSSEEAYGLPPKLYELFNEKSIQATILVGKQDLHYGIARMLKTMYELQDPNYPSFVVRNDEELNRTVHDILS